MSEVNGINGLSLNPVLQWKVGLVTWDNKYLTAEPFGFKINAEGVAFKKKQLWFLEQDPKEEVVYIRSHLGRYLSTDKYGNMTCDTEEDGKGETEKFCVEYSKDGKWQFKHKVNGNYLQGNAEEVKDATVKCFAKCPSKSEKWTVQLSIHPQINLKNINRKRYCHLKDDQIQCNTDTPWGIDALITLEFLEGKYALKTCDNRYLNKSGNLEEELTEDCRYFLEIKSGISPGLVFKDNEGKYLSAVGSTATIKGRNKAISKDELFTIEDSHPQVIFVAHNGKKVSTRQGIDVSANQSEDTEYETFQVEYQKEYQKWAFKTSQEKYWCLETSTGTCGIQTNVKEITKYCMFDIEWHGDGTASIQAQNGKYLVPKGTGSMYATSASVTDKERFKVKIVNRSNLVLKSDFGFVGVKNPNAEIWEYVCNKVTHDLLFLTPSDNGTYTLKGQNGKDISVSEDNSLVTDGTPATPLIIEFKANARLSIKAPNNCYFKGQQNGLFLAKEPAGEEQISSAALLEY